MIKDLLAAFGSLFTTKMSRAQVALLILVMASIPVTELMVIRMFTHLVIDGPDAFVEHRDRVIIDGVIFFSLFALTRLVHHVVKILRIRVFRNRFDESVAARGRSTESWSWALALELSNVLTSFVQVAVISLFFLVLDVPTALVNLGAVLLVVALVSRFYNGQLGLQRHYIKSGNGPESVAVGERVRTRIVAAELGAMISSVGMLAVIVIVLYRTVDGDIESGDAVVFFLACRIMYGQIANLSGGVMRFARASARIGG